MSVLDRGRIISGSALRKPFGQAVPGLESNTPAVQGVNYKLLTRGGIARAPPPPRRLDRKSPENRPPGNSQRP
jgi:hypothetical protein